MNRNLNASELHLDQEDSSGSDIIEWSQNV